MVPHNTDIRPRLRRNGHRGCGTRSDYYDILGLAYDADAEEVKAAFHRLAKIYHPDLNAGDATAEARFKEINQAYETLSDSEKRAAYDLGLRGGPRVFRHTIESRGSATKSSATANHAPSSLQRWQMAASGMCIGVLLGFVVVPVVLWLSRNSVQRDYSSAPLANEAPGPNVLPVSGARRTIPGAAVCRSTSRSQSAPSAQRLSRAAARRRTQRRPPRHKDGCECALHAVARST
jgi:curved DNA-binding protein CbpA